MNAMKTLTLVLLGLLLTGCGASGGAGLGSSTTALQDAYDACSETYSNAVNVGDEGHTLIVDGAKPGNDDFTTMVCVLGELDTSQSVVAQMDSTTALMGRQTAEDGDYTYEWSYHPDNGMDLIITD